MLHLLIPIMNALLACVAGLFLPCRACLCSLLHPNPRVDCCNEANKKAQGSSTGSGHTEMQSHDLDSQRLLNMLICSPSCLPFYVLSHCPRHCSCARSSLRSILTRFHRPPSLSPPCISTINHQRRHKADKQTQEAQSLRGQ